jgi:hypothetical protein
MIATIRKVPWQQPARCEGRALVQTSFPLRVALEEATQQLVVHVVPVNLEGHVQHQSLLSYSEPVGNCHAFEMCNAHELPASAPGSGHAFEMCNVHELPAAPGSGHVLASRICRARCWSSSHDLMIVRIHHLGLRFLHS